jgi:formamidopyrimidine-DNA glycosylase
MPELPEVETVKNGLKRLLIGKTISAVTFDWPKSFPNDQSIVNNFLISSKIKSINRRGKVLIINLSTRYSLVVHLKMTGQLVYKDQLERFGAGHPNESLVGNLPDKSTRVIIDLSGTGKLFFNDQRKFGWMRLVPTVEVPNIDFFKKIGPEPLEDSFTWQVFRNRLNRRPNSMIKAVLLDQTVLAGIGNIYADESLWGAKIHPETRVSKISLQKVKKLHQAIVDVLTLSIEKGGSTDRNYVDAEGNKGSYLKFANVFRREGLACPRCGTTVVKMKVVGRGTHICPKEQRLVI